MLFARTVLGFDEINTCMLSVPSWIPNLSVPYPNLNYIAVR